jgi:hypothetical protein
MPTPNELAMLAPRSHSEVDVYIYTVQQGDENAPISSTVIEESESIHSDPPSPPPHPMEPEEVHVSDHDDEPAPTDNASTDETETRNSCWSQLS